MSDLVLRRLEPEDLEPAVRVWERSKKAAYPWLALEQGYTWEQNLAFFRDVICSRCDVWLAAASSRTVGLLAMEGSLIDQLYVAPEAQGRGVGSALLARARTLSPGGLTLFTHQRNERARRFYESRGFTAIRFGISPPPESEPDVEYAWRPEPGAREEA